MLFVGRRLLILVPVAFGVTMLVFLLIHLTPGDPAVGYLGSHATPQAIAAVHHTWGLDRPLVSQYVSFLADLAHGSLGTSLYYNSTVSDLIGSRLSATLLLLVFATIISVLLSVPLATLAATRQGTAVDHVVRAVPVVGLGMPSFWLGTILILLLGIVVPVFPVGGYGDTFLEHCYSLVLPGLTVALSIIPMLIRSLRSSLIESLDSDYVAFARSKGLRPRDVLTRYGLRNASISGVSVLGINIGFLVGGTLVIENVFALPGLGSLMVQGILKRDFPVVQGIALVFAVIVVVVYLLTDVGYALLDPRVRTQ
jgi:peptide/nickel transport system permease protein